MQDLNSFQQTDSGDDDAQAWAVPFADMMTLLLTLFILLIVILKESEKFVDQQINLILNETYKQLIEEIKDDNVIIERVTKGIQITIRGNLFRSMKAEVNPKFIPIISDISQIIKNCELFNLKESGNYDKLLDHLEKTSQELNTEVRCEGHTDNAQLPIQSKFQSNWELSSARAASVAAFFQRNGIRGDRITCIGKGEFTPIKTNKTTWGREKNRRIVIEFKIPDIFKKPKDLDSELNLQKSTYEPKFEK